MLYPFSLAFLAVLVNVKAQRPESEHITISSLPTFSTCQPAQIDWRGGSSPYRVYIYPEGWTNLTDWLIEMPITTRTLTIWNVNLAAGAGIVINVYDGVNDQYSEPSWIQDSGDNACLASNGTFQSDRIASSTTTAKVSSIMPSFSRATVVSTPTSSTTRPPTSSVVSTEPAPAPATVTIVQGQGNGAGMNVGSGLLARASVLCLCFAVGSLL